MDIYKVKLTQEAEDDLIAMIIFVKRCKRLRLHSVNIIDWQKKY